MMLVYTGEELPTTKLHQFDMSFKELKYLNMPREQFQRDCPDVECSGPTPEEKQRSSYKGKMDLEAEESSTRSPPLNN